MFILGRFRNIIFHLLKSVSWGNLITLQKIRNTDDVIDFSIFILCTKCGEILSKKSFLSFNEEHIKFIILPLLQRITVNGRQPKIP